MYCRAGTPHFGIVHIVSLLAAAAAAVAADVSCLYHTVLQAVRLSAPWRPRYNSSRRASLCGPLLTMRVLTWHMSVCCVCYDIRGRVLYAFVVYFVCNAAAAVVTRLYPTVPQALEVSTLWHPRHSSRAACLCAPI